MKAVATIISIMAMGAIAFAVYVLTRKSEGCKCDTKNGAMPRGNGTAQSGSSVPASEAVLTGLSASSPRTEGTPASMNLIVNGGKDTSSSDTYRTLYVATDGKGDCCTCPWKDGKCPCSLGPCGSGTYSKPRIGTSATTYASY